MDVSADGDQANDATRIDHVLGLANPHKSSTADAGVGEAIE